MGRVAGTTRGVLFFYENVCTPQKLKFHNGEREWAPGIDSSEPSSIDIERSWAKSDGVAIRTGTDAHTEKDERIPGPGRPL
jgi:hypothetical protein